MKKLLLSHILFFVAFVSAAQHEINNHSPKANPSAPATSEVQIGITTYDLQSYASVRNQLYYYPNGTVGAVWNFDINLTNPVPQTAYNYYNGLTWNAIPTTGIDSSGFGSINRFSNGTEVICSYDASTASGLRIDTCNVPGTSCWAGTLLPPEPNGHQCGWAHSAVGGANGMSIHVVSLTEPVSFGGFAYSGVDGMLTYSRSEDGGATWNIVHATLPGWNSTFTKRMMPDHYTIDARGNTVAITAGGKTNDWVLWKSTDNGTTFTKTIIDAFPIAAYDEFTMISDTNADAIADTMVVPDGSLEVLIDNSGMVHCWSGLFKILDDDPVLPVQIINEAGALVYWNESMGSATPVIIAVPIDYDGDGALTFGSGYPKYGSGICSMPSAGITVTGRIYVCYSCMVENTSNGGFPDQSYRDIYGTSTNDNGITWTPFFNLNMTDFDEEVFPSMARNVDAKVRLVYMRDGEPGLSFWGDLDPIGSNFILYAEIDTSQYIIGNALYLVSGNVYYDANSNAIYDGGDNYVSSNSITVKNTTNGNIDPIWLNGSWMQPFYSGTHKLYIDPLPYYLVSVPDTATVTVTNANVSNIDFALQALSPKDSAGCFIHNSFPRCNDTVYHEIFVNNLGTTTGNFVVKFHPDVGIVSFVSSVPPPDSVVAGNYYFSLNTIQPFLSGSIDILLGLPGAGITLIHYADVYKNNSGVLNWMNSDTVTYTTSCAYDPNDKGAEPIGVGAQHYTLKTDTLEYLIRFQNTGNDTAFNVFIVDTLDANFDVSTFQLLNTSHQCNIEILAGNILRFRFNNILLPDSNVNEPASHGYIRYRIKPLNSTPVNTIVYNTAHIFFDFNLPVATNTAFNTLVNVIPSGISENTFGANDVSIIPNPFNETVKIVFENKNNDEVIILISDLAGRIIYRSRTIAEEFLWDAKSVDEGIYLLSLQKSLTGRITSALMVKQ